jgi:putative iron-dependent peroxidase
MKSASKTCQSGILAPVPAAGRHLFFELLASREIAPSLRALAALADGEEIVVGIGQVLAEALGKPVPGLRAFPALRSAEVAIPSTPATLWCWLRGKDRGELWHRSREVERALAGAFRRTQAIDAFKYGSGRDLTGYEDGTENPKAAAAAKAALAADGSSYAAVQLWLHDFERFDALSPKERDEAIGRRRRDNMELADAPASAHVKRTAQETFDPPAFLLRRSMPWSDERRAGLAFVAFGRSFDAFEAQLRRMAGAEDGIADALFRFTQPLTGGYYWCPPLRKGRLDLRALGLE